MVQYVYDAWGNHAVLDLNGKDITSATNIGTLNPFRYRGYYYDTETGLYFLQTRYYDPELCRFMTIDGIEYVELNPLSGHNLYAYCGNNPVMYIDPNGHSILAFLLGLVISAITVAVVNTGVQLIGDIINFALTGQWSSGWEEYVGAFIGGLAGGVTFFLTGGNLLATFGVMGGVESISTNLLTNATGKTNYSFDEIFLQTIFFAGVGLFSGWALGGTKIAGVSIGKNSFMAVWKSGLTKLAHGTATKMSGKVILKGLVGFAALKSGGALFKGFATGAYNWVRELIFGEYWRVFYV